MRAVKVVLLCCSMNIIPAIDLLKGQVVHIVDGDPQKSTVYANDPYELVYAFGQSGLWRLHIVDVDGIFSGNPQQQEQISALVDLAHRYDMQVQVGGGIRTSRDVEQILSAGADFVVLGTMAVQNPAQVQKICRQHPGHIVVAVDHRNDHVMFDGWRQEASVSAHALAIDAASWEAAAILFTDVSLDGTKKGPAITATAALQQELIIPVIAGGGVGSLADLDALRDAGIRAVVVGTALYEHCFSVDEAVVHA